jgi:MFS family permease
MVLIDISPLKHANFRRLYFSQLISMLGSQMTMITIPFQVYALTKSTFQTGLVSAVELICLISTALLGGVLADKLDRRKIIVVAEIAMMIVVSALALNACANSPLLWLIYVLAGLSAAINGFHRPAFESLTPLLVPYGDLGKVSSLISFKVVTASLLGPTIAGFLVASCGPIYTYWIDALSFSISLIFLMRIKISSFVKDSSKPNSQSLLKEVADGGRYIYSRKDILGSYVIDFCAMVFCMPQVLFPAFAQFYGMNSWLGTLYFSVALGGVVATLFSGWTNIIKRLGVAISCAAMGWAFAIFCIGVIPSFWALPFGLFLAGAFDGYSGIFRMTMWNESISNDYRGRLASFSMLSYTSGPLLGNTLMGFLGDFVGLHQALALGSTISLLVMAIILLYLPAYWNYRSLSQTL